VTPYHPPSIASNRLQVGSAIYLYAWLSHHTHAVNAWWQPVANGEAMSDEELAAHLDVSPSMICRWRDELAWLGYLCAERVNGQCWRYWLVNPNVPDSGVTAAEEPASKPQVVN
jgi:hypothetical protein